MKAAVILFAVLASTLAKPNGYYHQEYNYQTSSSSYKNNELQHRNDDEGYYSKDGDLEGRLRPRVNAHSQHSEYVNPKLQHGYRIGTDRTSSFGQLHAQNRYQYGEPGLGGPEMVGGAFPVMGGPEGYGVSSNLREVTASLQHQMEIELQRAVQEQHQRAMAYGQTITQAQIETDRRLLEEELRRNMTMRIEDALKAHYGNQGIRGAYSYSIIDGRLQPRANYNNQELVDLTRQMEAHLLRHLDQQLQTQYHTRVDTQVHTTRNTYRRHGVNDNYPSSMVQRPVVYPYPQPYPQPQPQPQPQPMPHPVAHIPDSITTVATRVQTELNEILNKILEDTQRRYFAENSFNSGVNYDAILAQLQDELRANITFHFDDQIKRAYGYTNYVAKYSIEDIENLRRQIETNLVTKLNRDFNRQRERYFQTHQVYMAPRPVHSNQMYYPVNNVHYQADVATMQRQLQEQLSRQLQTALMQQSYRQAHAYAGPNFNPQAQYQETLQQLSAELNRNLTRQLEMLNTHQYQSGAYASQMADMRNQLQHDLMRQLQHGLQQSFSRYSSWSSSSSSSSSSNANYRPVRGFNQNVYNLMGDDCMMGDDASAHSRKKRSPPVQYYRTIVTVPKTENADDSAQQNQYLQQNQQLDGSTYQWPSTYIPPPTAQGQTLDDSDLTQVPQQPFYNPPPQRDLPPEQSYNPQFEQVPGQPLILPERLPVGQVSDDSDLTQQTEDIGFQKPQYPPSQRFISQQPQTPYVPPPSPISQQPFSQRTVKPLYSNYQQPNRFYEENTYRNRYQSPRTYTSTYDWYSQRQNAQRETVNQRVKFYEDLNRQSQYQQRPIVRPPPPSQYQQIIPPPKPYQPAPSLYQTQDVLGQQTDNSDLTQQSQDLLGQQTDNSDLTQSQDLLGQQTEDDQTQQVQTPNFQPEATQWSQVNDLNKPSSGSQQTDFDKLRQQQANIFADQQNQSQEQDSTEKIEDLDGAQNINQQSQKQTEQISDSGLDQQTQDLTYQGRDLTQQTQQINEDLTQQTQDLIKDEINQYQQYRQNPTTIPNSIEKDRDLTQQTQDLTQQTQDLSQYQQTEDLTQQSRDLTQQTQDLTQSEDLTQQSQDLTQQTQDLGQQYQDLTQQSEDLTQQNEDLTQQTQDLGQQYQDLTQQPQQSYDLTQQTEDLTQQTQDLGQQYQDLTQQPQQSEDLTQQSEDLTQQTQDLGQQYQDLTQQPQQSEDLTQQSEDLTQQTQDLTQQTQDLGQQYQDLTQQAQQSEDLTQQTQQSGDLTQQTEDLTQQYQNLNQYPQSENLHQQTQDLLQHEINQHQQSEYQPPEPPQRQNEDIDQQRLIESQRQSQHLIDLLKQQQQRQRNNNINPMQYSPQPVYGYHNGQPVQVGTTRGLHNYPQTEEIPEYQTVPETESFKPEASTAKVSTYEKPRVSYVETSKPETVSELETEQVQQQVANEVQSVEDPSVPPEPEPEPEKEEFTTEEAESEEVTTKKPGFWARVGKRFKNIG